MIFRHRTLQGVGGWPKSLGCVNFGQRVQASVFECSLDPTQLKLLQRDILNVIDTNTDSVRFYNLGKNYKNRIEHFGAKPSYMPDDVLMV